MSGRKMLHSALSATLPGWQVVSDARALDAIRRPGAAVMWTAKRAKAPALGLDWFTDEVTLWILTPTDRPADLEDSLDSLLLTVMEALEPLDAFHWETAERGVLAEKFEGYRLTITCAFRITTT